VTGPAANGATIL
jgi:ABC-type oligopeptide transport system ATPase subunit